MGTITTETGGLEDEVGTLTLEEIERVLDGLDEVDASTEGNRPLKGLYERGIYCPEPPQATARYR